MRRIERPLFLFAAAALAFALIFAGALAWWLKGLGA